jgi:hypothetical protein
MTKRHQASRRRTYARRQHELNERASTLVPVMDWDTADDYLIEPEWLVKRLDALVPAITGDWPARRLIG